MTLRNGIMAQARKNYLSEYGLTTRRNVNFFQAETTQRNKIHCILIV